MKHLLIFIVLLITVAVINGCSNQNPTDPVTDGLVLEKNAFVTRMSPEQEVTPNPVISDASGHAIFTLRPDGLALNYRVIVVGITNVTASHIHLAPAGANGPVVAFLYNLGPNGLVNGVLAEGTITEANLIGPLAGQPLSALIDAINAGGAYVNVHTQVYPAGEIRGQL